MIRSIAKVLCLAVALVSPSALATQRSLSIERFDARIRVNRDASIDVTETIRVRFTGSWNGLYRSIPVEYRTPQGFNWTLRMKLQSVTDDAGTPLKTETSRERHYLKHKIWVPGAEDAVRTIVLSYQARNGLRFFEDHDELYWNVTGDEWDVPIESSSAVIELPAGATGIRTAAFTGAYGSTAADAAISTDGGTVTISRPTPLAFREGLTAVVGWDKGAVIEPTTGDRILGFLAANWPLAIPIPVFVAMFLIWRRRGRDPERLPISVQYEPPNGMTPAETGTLIDNKADMRDITATVVDLAVRGYLRIEDREEPKLFGLLKGREFVFHREMSGANWSSLKAHERAVLDGIFATGKAEVPMSDLENKFYTKLEGIRKKIFEQLISRGCYRSRPDSVQAAWIAGAVALGFAIVFGGSLLSPFFNLTPIPFVIAGFISAVIVALFGVFMPARTVAGTRLLERVLGFEQFLERVEGDRLREFVKTPEMFERYLPFAMAFGVEKNWAKAFEGIYTQAPTWYSGSSMSGFNAMYFSSRMSAMSTAASSTMSSSPRTSSGSGFSGGGFSGGGGGGGGGGGF